jgi:hypothetical protein
VRRGETTILAVLIELGILESPLPRACRTRRGRGSKDAGRDQAVLRQRSRYAADFRIERNGNGRDFDVIPSFTGEYAHGYVLRVEIVPSETGKETAVLHSSGYYVDGNSKLQVFLRQDEIRKRFPDFALDRPYTLRATLILDVGNGGQSGLWSEGFIEQVFPIRERSQSVTRQIRF